MDSSREPLTKGLYSNCVMRNPDNEFMCYIPEKKMNWYLKKDLATVVDEKTIMLKFAPKGSGHFGDEYYSEERTNSCVICNCDKDLSKHHIVPYQYRRHFPATYSSHTHFDVVMVCNKCHDIYELQAFERNKKICDDFDVPMHLNEPTEQTVGYLVNKYASPLLEHGSKIPKERKEILYGKLTETVGYEVTEHNIEELCQEHSKYIGKQKKTYRYSELVVEKIPDILEFMVGWRQHFLDIMKPEYLSDNWLKTYKTRSR